LIWGSLQILWGQLVNTLQKFIKNSNFVQKIQFRLCPSFLTFIFVWKKSKFFVDGNRTNHSYLFVIGRFTLEQCRTLDEQTLNLCQSLNGWSHWFFFFVLVIATHDAYYKPHHSSCEIVRGRKLKVTLNSKVLWDLGWTNSYFTPAPYLIFSSYFSLSLESILKRNVSYSNSVTTYSKTPLSAHAGEQNWITSSEIPSPALPVQERIHGESKLVLWFLEEVTRVETTMGNLSDCQVDSLYYCTY